MKRGDPTPHKTDRINLGLAIASLHCRRGVPMSCGEIAAYCGCSKEAIRLIEKQAIRKLMFRAKELQTESL